MAQSFVIGSVVEGDLVHYDDDDNHADIADNIKQAYGPDYGVAIDNDLLHALDLLLAGIPDEERHRLILGFTVTNHNFNTFNYFRITDLRNDAPKDFDTLINTASAFFGNEDFNAGKITGITAKSVTRKFKPAGFPWILVEFASFLVRMDHDQCEYATSIA